MQHCIVGVVLCVLCVSAATATSLRGSKQVIKQAANALPVVIWHGMGDSCCSPYSTGAIKKLIEDRLGVFVYSIATGETEASDVWSTYFGDVNSQVAKVCAQLRSMPELAGGYNAIGFSQGGQFLRAVVQRCNHLGPKARTLITFGAQHQGVMNIPGCNALPSNLTLEVLPEALDAYGSGACQTMQTLLAKGAYLPWVRDHVVQAQYFKDPNHLSEYLHANIFLPDINNEKQVKSEQYKSNLASLDKLVLYRFTQDTTVVPRDSAWFYFFDGKELQRLEDQTLYKEDWLGLKQLQEDGRLVLDDIDGKHMQFTLSWFEEKIIGGYLAGTATA
mmetsp:Transcript_37671/g.83889  ORF Transcript_37671/g.83889 Transcript_37671/m.83889 type:complete len:332 (+) Transcript_37671:101-1096(+)